MGNDESELKQSEAYGEFRLEGLKGSKMAVVEKMVEKSPQLRAELHFDL